MKLLLLGTAAAEAWPAPFCSCPACRHARSAGGRNIRRRSSALLDDSLLVDFGPDTSAQVQAFNRSLSNVTTLAFTHHHEDHLSPDEIAYRAAPFTVSTDLPLMQIFGSETVVEILRTKFPDAAWNREKARMVIEEALIPHEARTAADGARILPLPADHAPKSLVLRIAKNGRSFLYGHDTGLFPDETIEALRGAPLDLVLLDCTYGAAESSNRGHMGIDGVIETAKRLGEVGAVTKETRLVATHYSHNGKASYEELVSRLAPEGILAAYDGLEIEF
ncbi:MAG: MBL fold metallo-hydrolase [Capsulimonadaceae bacterium]|nr:MBL fold metallo-hydrolase [Capsulimonadaceae bacterium]